MATQELPPPYLGGLVEIKSSFPRSKWKGEDAVKGALRVKAEDQIEGYPKRKPKHQIFVRVSPDRVMDILFYWKDTGISWIPNLPFPKDTRLDSVFYDWKINSFVLRFEHESFPEVFEGEEPMYFNYELIPVNIKKCEPPLERKRGRMIDI